ncbi:MAG: hypothetical protein KDJ78_05725 [Rhodobacteraceae bacterium]|uniref:hypothetical protein n=1 Tax=Amaricoccus sp. TaxID=1872485 RepID=UPI001D847CC5|nr:hypothetical protein [Amaricoccus sp.]MCB1373663.1 hypothetical protein [Paracoccaceae bacterium]HRW14773.1 hypothetical protein [Amaricoccus sp.]
MTVHDPDAYVACMNEIKHRTAIVDNVLGVRDANRTIPIPNVEMAALQIRKVYELVAFASLAANKGRFNREWKMFAKEWRLDQIVKRISKWNPEFLPMSIVEEAAPQPGIRAHILDAPERSITSLQLVERHGRLGEVLHARNPFSKQVDYNQLAKRLAAERNDIVDWLNIHRVSIQPGQLFYRVIMKAEDNQVHCAQLVSSAHIKSEP